MFYSDMKIFNQSHLYADTSSFYRNNQAIETKETGLCGVQPVDMDSHYVHIIEKYNRHLVREKPIAGGSGFDFTDSYRKHSDWGKHYKRLNAYHPVYVREPDARAMMKGFFSNSDKSIENKIKNANFTVYRKNGLPLSYSRDTFTAELDEILSPLPEEKKSCIFDKMGIYPVYKGGCLTGYDGFLTLENLDTSDETEAKIYTVADEFLNKNYVETNDAELNQILNSLIKGMPEFINIIGKKQHSAHSFSVDIHTLNVLQKCMQNPEYDKLSNTSKMVLKLAVIMHDIGKAEEINDNNHTSKSADSARNILERYTFPPEVKARTYDFVKNHHWLELYNSGRIKAADVGVLYRRSEDIQMARIFAEADLKGADNVGFLWNAYNYALSDSYQKPVDEAISKINQTGQLIYSSKIFNKDKIPTVEYKGNLYKVVDVNNLSDEQLSEIYLPNTKKSDLRYVVHIVPDDEEEKIDKLETAVTLGDTASDAVLSCSYISPDNKKTPSNGKFGLILDVTPENLANAYFGNEYSGTLKNQIDFIKMLTSNAAGFPLYRSVIPNFIKKNLELTDEEYAELYRQLQNTASLHKLNYEAQNDIEKTYDINGRSISSREIANAVKAAGDNLFSRSISYNEICVNRPQTSGFLAKVDSIGDIPEEYLEFIAKHNLPIILLGSD